ncbi:MAG: hypothetical protein EA397_06870 [Deltaproteobacteria bacterium]|nr:MAG: hypothetical protein EA397_06870 [Deltaproteobacteria bacterium]
MSVRWRHALPLATLLALSLPGCAGADFTMGEGRADAPEEYGDDGDGDGNGGAGEDLDDPELDDDFLSMPPSQSDVYVFVANPSRDTVSRIDVFSLEVRTAPVGSNPRVVRVTDNYAWAVVFNQGDNTVSILDTETLQGQTVGVRRNFNQMRMSAEGDWVALFHDRDAVRPDDPTPDGIQSFNEVSFVSVPDGEHHGVVVGYNPRDIKFSQDGATAVVVADQHLALVDLRAESLRPVLIPISDVLEPPAAEEVVLSGSGRYAFVRQRGADAIVSVDLDARSTLSLPVGANPTDLDLSPDGAMAVVVSRADNQIWIFDAEAPELPPEVLDLPEPLVAGSIRFNPDGDRAILYTTAALSRTFAIWNTQTDEVRLESLVKPVRGMAYTPTGDSLLVMHTRENSPDQLPGSDFYNHWAVSLLQVDDRALLQNAIKLPAEPMDFANAYDGRNGYFIMHNEPSLIQVDYDTLLYDAIALRSHPVFVGVLPPLETQTARPPAWASQEHDLGRISFFHPDSRRVETITGFELNNQIEE